MTKTRQRISIALMSIGITAAITSVAIAHPRGPHGAPPAPPNVDEAEWAKLSPEQRREKRIAHRAEIMKTFDVNKDGVLDLKERRRWAADRRAKMFAKWDTNKDNRLSADEVRALPGKRGAMFTKRFSHIDANGDSYISSTELESILIRRPLPGTRRHKRGRHR